MKLSFKNEREPDFLKQTKFERICCQYMCFEENDSRSSLEKRKRICIRTQFYVN